MKREIFITACIFVFFLGVIVFFSFYGPSNRVYNETKKIITVSEPSYAYKVWEEHGLKGRILFLFDRRLNAEPDDHSLSKENYVYWSIRKNIVRKVYHIIPDASWPEVERILSGYTFMTRHGNIFRFNISGASILIMRLKDMPSTKERALININGDYWNEYEIRDISYLLKNNYLRSDMIILSGNFSENSIEAIRIHEKFH